MNLKKHINIALGYFLIIAFLGALLRLFFVTNISLNYKHLVHAHSHIALLGWIYIALTTLIYFCFIEDKSVSKKYKRIFWYTQITLIGMLISFPITGYALYSIIFSTLFLIVSYWFLWFVNKHVSEKQKSRNSFKLIRSALWFMVISSIGPWALGAIMNTLGSTSIWYKNAIYFYLHFQYNGWFIVALWGIFIYILEKQNIHFPKKEFNRFYWLLISSVILTFFISVLWTKPPIIFNLLGGIGAIIQLIAFCLFLKLIMPYKKQLQTTLSSFCYTIFKTVSVLFIIKMILQLVSSTTYFSTVAAKHIDFVIGYLHWAFLGVVSIALLGILHYFKLISLPKRVFQLYFLGFILTEGLLFYKGTVNWLNLEITENYYELLAIASCVLLIAIAFLFIKQLMSHPKK